MDRRAADEQDHIVVTGAAGFIGSHLCDRLLADGHTVVGIDSFEDYYARELKEANLAGARAHPSFTLVEEDLLDADLPALLDGAACVYHLAAQAGVRASWGTTFEVYTRNNVLATQQLLEACLRGRRRPRSCTPRPRRSTATRTSCRCARA